jgi:thiamine-monophosphate kinase
MMDLSDGLASDVRRVCDLSGVGCDVDLDLLPMKDDTRELTRSLGRDPAVLAATGGEDYELLISAPEQVLDALAESIGVPLMAIGEITQEHVAFKRGNEPVGELSGWDHFA